MENSPFGTQSQKAGIQVTSMDFRTCGGCFSLPVNPAGFQSRKSRPRSSTSFDSFEAKIKAPPVQQSAPGSRAEFNPIAFPRSSLLSTISITNDYRMGISKAFILPMKTLRVTMCRISISLVGTSAAKTSAWTMDRPWVRSSNRLRFHLSAATPANGLKKRVGAWLAKATTPSRSVELVRLWTSRLSATCCVHVPIREVTERIVGRTEIPQQETRHYAVLSATAS